MISFKQQMTWYYKDKINKVRKHFRSTLLVGFCFVATLLPNATATETSKVAETTYTPSRRAKKSYRSIKSISLLLKILKRVCCLLRESESRSAGVKHADFL